MSKDLGTQKLKLGRGRPTKNEVVVRQTLEMWLEIEDLVGADVKEAYNVIREIMLDKQSSPAQREKCATKILEMHARFYKNRVKGLESSDDEDNVEDEETAVVFKFNAG